MDPAPAGFPLILTSPSSWSFALLTLLAIGAVSDWRRAKIPNWLTYSGMAGGLLLHVLESGVGGLGMSAGGMVVGMGLFLGFYVLGGMGAGDVKLMGLVGGFVGIPQILPVAVAIALFGGAYALAVAIGSWGIREGVNRVFSVFLACALTGGIRRACSPPDAQPKLRYGVVIALGTAVALWWPVRL